MCFGKTNLFRSPKKPLPPLPHPEPPNHPCKSSSSPNAELNNRFFTQIFLSVWFCLVRLHTPLSTPPQAPLSPALHKNAATQITEGFGATSNTAISHAVGESGGAVRAPELSGENPSALNQSPRDTEGLPEKMDSPRLRPPRRLCKSPASPSFCTPRPRS